MTSITITEYLDINSLQHINKKYVSLEEGKTIENIRKKISKTGSNQVEYKYDKNTKRLSAKTPSIQYLNKYLRSYFCKEHYKDVDMVACAINILFGLVKKHKLEDYETLIEELRVIKKLCDKKQFNSCIFGNQNLEMFDKTQQILFKKLRKEIVDLEKSNVKEKDVSDGQALSHIIFYYEYVIMKESINYFNQNEIEYSTIIFDGIHLKSITEEQLLDLQKHILTETYYFDMPWKIIQLN